MDWITHIKLNGNSALKEIYSLHRIECVAWLMNSYNLQEAIAKDAFQLSILLLYQNVMKGQLVELSSSLKSYLYAIAKNKARDLIKDESKYSSSRKMELLKEEISDGVAEKEKFEYLITRVQNAMIKMGDPCKTILQLFYFKRMQLQEIARHVGHKQATTTKTKKHKCLKRLSGMVSEHKVLHLGVK